jgi:hypothetical protein
MKVRPSLLNGFFEKERDYMRVDNKSLKDS